MASWHLSSTRLWGRLNDVATREFQGGYFKDMAMLEQRIKRASKTRQAVNQNPPPAAAEPPPPEPRQQAGNRNTSRPGMSPSGASAEAVRDNKSEV